MDEATDNEFLRIIYIVHLQSSRVNGVEQATLNKLAPER